MPNLNLSAAVFAEIWARRAAGEETEDRILRRILGMPAEAPATPPSASASPDGFVDATYGVRFAEGFEISRLYKGRSYAARVRDGRWLLDADGRAYDSLNQLSQAVIDGNENAWMFWFYRTASGERRRIAGLRDPALVQKRPRRKRPRPVLSGPGAPPEPAARAGPPTPATKPWEPPGSGPS